MKAARLGKIMKGQIKNLTEREQIALDWCKDHTYEMPDEKWMEQSENHYDAYLLIPDIYHYRNQNAEAR